MFRKRQKKHFPPETFIPNPARICAIIQLCLAFSLLLWNLSEPFVGEIFTLKSRQLVYQDVMGIPSFDHLSPEKINRLERNAERFKALPDKTQKQLLKNYTLLQELQKRSFLDKVESMFSLLFRQISSFETAWIFFSVVVSIMLLKKIEGASQAVWILPLLVAFYAIDIRWYQSVKSPSLESQLYPSENEIVDQYITPPFSKDVFEQQTQLIEGWKRYLVINWAHEQPSNDPVIFNQQAEEGEFLFSVERLNLQSKDKHFFVLTKSPSSPSLFLILIYFFWNTYFAYTAWKCTRPSFSHTT